MDNSEQSFIDRFCTMGLISQEEKIQQLIIHFKGRVSKDAARHALSIFDWNVRSTILKFDSLMHPPSMAIVKAGLLIDLSGGPTTPKLVDRLMRMDFPAEVTLFRPNCWFMSVWRVKNNGTTQWPEGCQLVFHNVPYRSPAPVMALHPNQETNISVEMCTPALPGPVTVDWQMVDPLGSPFGARLVTQFYVEDPTANLSNLLEELQM